MTRGWNRALLAALFGLLIPAGLLSGYYHFVHFGSGSGAFEPMAEKFDLADLVDDTVHFYVSGSPPRLAPTDSYDAVLSQIRQALSVWDSVPTSSLRVAYGGLSDGPLQAQSPAGEIIFAELPPGVIGLGGPVTRGQAKDGFVPIVRSQVILSNNLSDSSRPRASFSELFFNSLVHELGHALGLQHTLTSSAMSTDVTRATTRALPLGADDVAGLSVLYPTPDFTATYGSIEGRVTFRGAGAASLASVVAINPNGEAVSALTSPDGRYRIDGLLPGSYLIYVHPLPPATQDGLGPANIVLPSTPEGQTLAASAPFKTVFYGGTNVPRRSTPIEVLASRTTSHVDFAVDARGNVGLYGITTYSFPGNGAPGVHPAFLDVTRTTGFVLATGPGLTSQVGQLEVEVLGSDVRSRQPTLYALDPRFARLDFGFSAVTNLTPKHLVFGAGNDIYVLPSGVRLTSRPAPIVHWIEPTIGPDGEALWSVRGENFDARSSVYFDGWPARVVGLDPFFGEITVEPPAGAPGREAVVMVYNPDGQSSAFTMPDGSVTFSFAPAVAPSIEVSPAAAPPDTDLLVDIQGFATRFRPGETVVGFGTSDVVARDVYVVSPNHLRTVATVRGGALPGSYLVTVTTGLETAVRSRGFRVAEASEVSASRPVVRYQSLVNSASMQPLLAPGALASLFGTNLLPPSGDASGLRVTLNGQPLTVLSASANQLNLHVPYSAGPGRAVLVVDNGVEQSDPMMVQIERTAPGLFQAFHADGRLVDSSNPVADGETLAVLATGLGALASPEALANPELAGRLAAALQVLVGAHAVKPLQIVAAQGFPGLTEIWFAIPPGAAGVPPISVSIGGQRSNELTVESTSAANLSLSYDALDRL